MWALTWTQTGPTSIVHYVNGRWAHATGTTLDNGRFTAITALSDNNVWAAALTGNHISGYLVHRTADGWHTVVPPWPHLHIYKLAPDGSGGLWILAGDGISYVIHRSATGRWSRVTDGPYVPLDIALVPGTTSLWSVGSRFYSEGSADVSQGQIFGYGMPVNLSSMAPGR